MLTSLLSQHGIKGEGATDAAKPAKAEEPKSEMTARILDLEKPFKVASEDIK